MIGKMNLGSGGGIDLEGLIEQYKVANGTNVNAGSFVKFIEEYDGGIEHSKYENAFNRSSDNSTGYSVICVPSLDTIVVARIMGSSQVQIDVGNIFNNQFILNSSTTIATNMSLGYIYVFSISSDRFVVIYSNSSSANVRVYSIDLEKKEINLVKENNLSSYYQSGKVNYPAILQYSNNKFLVIYMREQSASSYPGYARFINIADDGTATETTATQVLKGSMHLSATILDDKNILCSSVFTYESEVKILNINGDTISVGKELDLSSKRSSEGRRYLLPINAQKVLICMPSSDYKFTIGVININDDKLSLTNETVICDETVGLPEEGETTPKAILLVDNKILIMAKIKDTKIHTKWYCTINENNITTDNIETMDGNINDLIPTCIYGEHRNFILLDYLYPSSSNTLEIIDYSGKVITKVKPLESKKDTIVGVTKQKGTEGQVIDVYVPNI